MLCTGVLLLVLFILLCFHNDAPFFFGNRRRRYLRRRRAQHLLSISAAMTPPPSAAAASEGLDLSVNKTIPTLIYSDIAKASDFIPLTCAVCLSEFENDEKARVLPNCSHAFHVDCIDMWFYTHSNCPLCRAPVQSLVKEDIAARVWIMRARTNPIKTTHSSWLPNSLHYWAFP
ncbi:hypothetical protein ES319_D06G221100v1 [Gossypium barbadense]|uniref:RING-type E3 ubiquitin transferase n=3 Tax=Gossypium TaxID=3633 RepID=A0A5J5R984_GOSBA|nr:hypothetical protein ES319_D06G221100v1 [Gossypium barbadense]TYG66016.1 hypothetical protein ES288_D06G233700v1 [Gossypium darwinii]